MLHDREVALKSSIMKSAAKPLMRHVLRDTEIDIHARVAVLHTHVMPTGEYALGCCAELAQAELGRYHRTITDLNRIVDRSERMSQDAAAASGNAVRTNVEVYSRLGVMAPQHRFKFARVRLLCQLLGRQQTMQGRTNGSRS